MFLLVRMYIKSLKFDLQNKSVCNERMKIKKIFQRESLTKRTTNFQTDLV